MTCPHCGHKGHHVRPCLETRRALSRANQSSNTMQAKGFEEMLTVPRFKLDELWARRLGADTMLVVYSDGKTLAHAKVVCKTPAGDFLIYWLATGEGGVIGSAYGPYFSKGTGWRFLNPDDLSE